MTPQEDHRPTRHHPNLGGQLVALLLCLLLLWFMPDYRRLSNSIPMRIPATLGIVAVSLAIGTSHFQQTKLRRQWDEEHRNDSTIEED